MQAGVIITAVAAELQDPNHVRWSLAKLLAYLSSAQRAVALVRPDATAQTAVVTLAAGTKQSLPASSHRLLKVIRNMGADGATPGQAIRKTEADTLDRFDPNWHAASRADKTVLEYVYDDRVPLTYYVNPPVPATPVVQVEISYSAVPAELAAESDPLAVNDVYEAALRHWTLYLAYSLNVEQRNVNRAGGHFQAFFAVLGVKTRSDMMVSPNATETKQ
jgi:hypothetical protein